MKDIFIGYRILGRQLFFVCKAGHCEFYIVECWIWYSCKNCWILFWYSHLELVGSCF